MIILMVEQFIEHTVFTSSGSFTVSTLNRNLVVILIILLLVVEVVEDLELEVVEVLVF